MHARRLQAMQALRRAASLPARVCFDPVFRSTLFLKLFNGRNLHQATVMTSMNRYPRTFSACQQYFEGRRGIRILSFGCATGEEVLTLRQYFPDAFIVGAELNRRSLAICRRLTVDERITFVYSDQRFIAAQDPFDAVFCMAVLQRAPHHVQQAQMDSIRDMYPFDKFDDQIRHLDAVVKTNGLLVLERAQYDLADSSVGGKYEPYDRVPFDEYPRFDRDGRRKPAPVHISSVFVKRRD